MQSSSSSSSLSSSLSSSTSSLSSTAGPNDVVGIVVVDDENDEDDNGPFAIVDAADLRRERNRKRMARIRSKSKEVLAMTRTIGIDKKRFYVTGTTMHARNVSR
jgi:hypothetical protein